jgi:hypothetical protein
VSLGLIVSRGLWTFFVFSFFELNRVVDSSSSVVLIVSRGSGYYLFRRLLNSIYKVVDRPTYWLTRKKRPQRHKAFCFAIPIDHEGGSAYTSSDYKYYNGGGRSPLPSAHGMVVAQCNQCPCSKQRIAFWTQRLDAHERVLFILSSRSSPSDQGSFVPWLLTPHSWSYRSSWLLSRRCCRHTLSESLPSCVCSRSHYIVGYIVIY